ncbi:MAG: twin transmembrane helix small protein [Gemmatimonas sp.]
MAEIAAYAIPFLMAAVLIVLITGIVNFSRKSHSPRTSNKLMQARVILQGAAILLFLLLMLLSRH